MINVEYKEQDNRINTGDVFLVDEEYALQLISVGNEASVSYGLLNLNTFVFERLDLKAVPHAINWVKKYYGNFVIVKKDDVNITLTVNKK